MSHSILIVDDDGEFRAFIASLVVPKGYKVQEAARLAEARAALEQTRFDICVVDGLLPDGTGMELIADLRARQPEAKIIFMSAFWRDMQTFKKLTEQLFVTRVISKPCLAREFLIQLEAVEAHGEPPADPRESTPLIEAQGFETQLAALREAYSEKLEGKVRELAEAYATARAKGLPPELLEQTLRLAHKLHGTAGAYGFSEVSAAAATIEGVLREVAQGHLEAGVTAWREVNKGLRQLNEALSRRREVLLVSSPGGPVESFRKYDLRVLCADPDPALLAEIESIGRRNLVDVVKASNLEETIEAASEGSYDGALLSVAWPDGGSGFQIAQALRSLDRLATLPVAFVAEADAALRDRVAAAYSGTSLFITKPIAGDQLTAAFDYFNAIKRADQPRILILDDDDAFNAHLSSILTHDGIKVSTLADPTRILETLASERPDLLILDVILPSLSGFDVCKMLRSTPDWQTLPILFLTVKLGAEDRLACFEAGGDDYLPKPVVAAELLARIKVRIDRLRLHQERVNRDALTGLLARQAFVDSIEKRLAENRRTMRPLSLCLIDLDRFKLINDTHGHLAGDRVLRAVGKLLHSRFRTEDVRGRWGGEEFVVAFSGEGVDTAREMLMRVLIELRQMSFADDHGEPFGTSFSAGVALFPDDGYTLEELIRAADRRLYAAKEAGRNRVVV
jgi:diguanylate cyclase (GGDEF)-like protein